jgi:hypothetical protein
MGKADSVCGDGGRLCLLRSTLTSTLTGNMQRLSLHTRPWACIQPQGFTIAPALGIFPEHFLLCDARPSTPSSVRAVLVQVYPSAVFLVTEACPVPFVPRHGWLTWWLLSTGGCQQGQGIKFAVRPGAVDLMTNVSLLI